MFCAHLGNLLIGAHGTDCTDLSAMTKSADSVQKIMHFGVTYQLWRNIKEKLHDRKLQIGAIIIP